LKKLFFLHIVIFSLCLSARAQSYKQTYEHARALYLNGQFEEAIIDLRRVLFFDNNSNPEVCLLLGDCYRNLKTTEKSMYYYQLAFGLFDSDSMKLETKFQIISLYLINNEPNYAISQIFSLPEKLNDNNEFRKNFYSSLAYYQIHDYKLSHEYFLKSFCQPSDIIKSTSDSIYMLAIKNNDANIYLPMFLSIIPGVGQLYLGEYEAAINSFLLTGLFTGLYIVALGNLPLIDAVLTVAPWFERYYQGGMLKAKALAIAKKEKKDDELYNILIEKYQNFKHHP
jgi:tetratricopeptide (TPR) repeat protein